MKDLPKHRSVSNTGTGTTNIVSSSTTTKHYNNHNNNNHNSYHHPSSTSSTLSNTKSSSSSTTTLLSLLCNKRIRIVLATCMIMLFVLHHQIHFVWNFMLLHTGSEDTNIIPQQQQQQHHHHQQQRLTDITRSKTKTKTTLSRGNDRQITSSSSAVTIDASSTTTQPTTTTSSSSSTTTTTTEIWPPMDMIYHIWDTISTNPQDKIQRRLVIAASNGQYTDFAMNFIKSLQQHDVYNFVIVPLDNTAYNKLNDIYPDHTMPVVPELVNLRASTSSSLSSTTTDTKQEKEDMAASFRSKEFEIVTSTRPIFLNYFLQQNITIFYNDIDMVWQYNAWDTIDTIKYKTTSLSGDNNNNNNNNKIVTTTSTDTTTNNDNNHQQQYDVLLWMDGPVQICTCLLYMVPSITSNIIMNEWKYEIQTHLYPNDQKAFLIMAQKYNLLPSKQQQQKLQNNNKSKQQQLLVLLKNNVQLFQNNEQFPTGAMYDWEQQIQLQQQQQQSDSTSNEQHVQSNNNDWKQFVPNTSKSYIKQQNKKTNPLHAIIIHNNWIEGKQSKIQRFILSKLWFV